MTCGPQCLYVIPKDYNYNYKCLGYMVLDYQPETWVNTHMFRS